MAWLAHGQQSASADMVLLNGAITVGDASATEHEALAIRGEHILAVGTNAEIAALAQPQTTVVDLEGRRVIPGLIDSHMHLVRAGLTWNDELHWDGIASLDAALALIAQAAATQPEGSWIRVVGAWHPGQFAEKRGPSRADLNAVAPRHPVYVQMLYEDALINDAALRICEIATETSDPQGGVFERDAAGAPTGRMRGVAAFNYVLQRMGSATLDQQIASTRAMLQAFGRVGLTTGIDTGGLGAAWDIYQPIFALGRQGNMGFRARLYVGATERGREQQQIADWMERFSGDPCWLRRPWRCLCASRRRWRNHRIRLPRSRRINPIQRSSRKPERACGDHAYGCAAWLAHDDPRGMGYDDCGCARRVGRG